MAVDYFKCYLIQNNKKLLKTMSIYSAKYDFFNNGYFNSTVLLGQNLITKESTSFKAMFGSKLYFH